MPRDGDLRLLFGSCRASAPHHPPHTFQRWWHPKGKGIDVLRTYAMRMLRQPSALWPDALMMMGDQLYADQVPDTVEEIVGDREVHADGPVEVLEDFEEYMRRLLGRLDAPRRALDALDDADLDDLRRPRDQRQVEHVAGMAATRCGRPTGTRTASSAA